MQRKLSAALLLVPFASGTQVGAESTVRLERDFTRRAQVCGSVEEHSAVLRSNVAALRCGRGVRDRALYWIIQERLRDCRSSLLVGFATLNFGGAPLRPKSSFELIVPCGFPEQFFDIR